MILLWLHSVGIVVFGVLTGHSLVHSLSEGSIVALAAVAASGNRASRKVRMAAATFGLLSASAILVHLSGGVIEMHFHFFVAVVIIGLYEDWFPFLLAIGFVVLHHGALGVLDPHSVYNHPAAWKDPWTWAAVHGGFILAESTALLVYWHVEEHARRQMLESQANYATQRTEADRLRTVNDMQTTFLSAVSHELRTPLTSVLGFAVTLRQEGEHVDEETRRDYLRRLEANARKLDRLLRDLLDVDRLARGVVEVRRHPTDVRALVARVVQDLDLSAHRISVLGDSPIVDLDGPKVERIVENLLANAAKFTLPSSTIELRLQARPNGVLITVDDNGPGVPDEMKSHIFEPFRQATTVPHAPGTGIGLSLVARFSELHGGSAWVVDRPGGGASFRVLLPGGAQAERPARISSGPSRTNADLPL